MANNFMSGFESLLTSVKAPVGTGAGKIPQPIADKPKYTIDPSIPENIRKIIEQSENSGKPLPDKIEGEDVETDKPKSFMEEMMETLGKGAGALGGALNKGATNIGSGAGKGGAAVAEKLGPVWIRWIIIVVGVIILGLGLYMFSNAGMMKATDVIMDSSAGKVAKKLIPAGKAASIAKGLL